MKTCRICPPRLPPSPAARARAAGVVPTHMRNRVRSGRWQRIQRGVYATFSGEPLRETVLWAALLRAGPDAVLSHQTAAERHGLIDEPSPVIVITVPASRHPAQVKIPGVVIHRSDAILRTRHPAMLPPCTRVEDTVLDLIQIALASTTRTRGSAGPSAAGAPPPSGSLWLWLRRKKMRWRREIAVALGDADDGALSVLEYRYVHRVERPHGLPLSTSAGANQAAHGQPVPRQPLRGVRGVRGTRRDQRRTQQTSSGATSAATTPTWSEASSRSGSASPNWAIAVARARLTSPLSCARAAGQPPPTPAPAQPARFGTGFHDRGQFRQLSGLFWPRS